MQLPDNKKREVVEEHEAEAPLKGEDKVSVEQPREELPAYEEADTPLLVAEKSEPELVPPPQYQPTETQDESEGEESDQETREYQTGLFDLDWTVLTACVAPCVTYGMTHADLTIKPDAETGEIRSPGLLRKALWTIPFLYMTCAVGPIATPMLSCQQRLFIRHKYELQTHMGTDCLAHTFCQPCAMAQDRREVVLRQEELREQFKRAQAEFEV